MRVHLHETPRGVRADGQCGGGCPGWGGVVGSYCLMDRKFRSYKVKELWKWIEVMIVQYHE